MKQYIKTIKLELPESLEKFGEMCPEFLEGVKDAQEMLRFAGQHPIASVSGIILGELINTLLPNTKYRSSGKLDQEKLAIIPDEKDLSNITIRHTPQRNEQLFGFACSLYAHFLPRFINTVLGRFQGDLWGCTKEGKFEAQLLGAIEKTDATNRAQKRQNEIKEELNKLEKELMDLDNGLKKLALLQSTSVDLDNNTLDSTANTRRTISKPPRPSFEFENPSKLLGEVKEQEEKEKKGQEKEQEGKTARKKHDESKDREEIEKNQDDERNVREEAERKTREEAERKTREEAERKVREEGRKKQETEKKAREEGKRKQEFEKKIREEAERKTREEAERKAKEETERKGQEEPEKKPKGWFSST